ncbi:hypothetical protein CR513_47898, partial [Mucuna pruriens]
MWDFSEERESCLLKTQIMIDQLKKIEAKLGEKIYKLEEDNRKSLDLIRRDTQSINANVEALSRERKEGNRVASLHESEGSHEEVHISESNVSFSSQRMERNQRHVRNERIERCERPRKGKEELIREKLDRNCKVDSYLNWELKVDQIFECFDYRERIKVRLVTLEFNRYALVWWNQVLEDIRSARRDPCESWDDLKKIMRERDLYNKLQRLYQGSKSMEEVPTLYHTKGVIPPSYKVEFSSKESHIKCFKCLGKCPNKRNMSMRENREIESESSQGDSTSSSEVESTSDHSHYEGDLLMVRRFMSNISGEKVESQKEKIFHFRSLVLGKLCSIIKYGGSSVNVARSRLVRKLGIPTLPHPKPYKLQGLSKGGGDRKHVNEVMCDVVSMDATYILLGRPWQIDRKVTHDRVLNRFCFVNLVEKVVLNPLSPREVCEDQIKMRIKIKEERKEK